MTAFDTSVYGLGMASFWRIARAGGGGDALWMRYLGCLLVLFSAFGYNDEKRASRGRIVLLEGWYETGYLDIPGTVALWHVIFGFVFKGHAFGMPLDLEGRHQSSFYVHIYSFILFLRSVLRTLSALAVSFILFFWSISSSLL